MRKNTLVLGIFAVAPFIYSGIALSGNDAARRVTFTSYTLEQAQEWCSTLAQKSRNFPPGRSYEGVVTFLADSPDVGRGRLYACEIYDRANLGTPSVPAEQGE